MFIVHGSLIKISEPQTNILLSMNNEQRTMNSVRLIVKVILKEKINKLGNSGEIVEVADGYARNFLLRKKLVLMATPGNIRQWEERGRIIQQKKEKVKFKAQKIADKLKEAKLILSREKGEDGKLFGVITSQDIVQGIKKKFNIEIDHRKVDLKEPIRVIGVKEVFLKLHPEVEIALKIEVKKAKARKRSKE
ncbi:50S ribosomal protein L9 [Candidatus Aerophobetes bacterium]|uniref:Large ribosomal subunit protein bL9 n=1 Tax=Aerophobetes bacterium TaxID=2030807 RepID=A0A523ZIL8_UNCAE|nr:MAG: 50S ribosomal protein L9 [Candidatus Aerophobetes bacterium]